MQKCENNWRYFSIKSCINTVTKYEQVIVTRSLTIVLALYPTVFHVFGTIIAREAIFNFYKNSDWLNHWSSL